MTNYQQFLTLPAITINFDNSNRSSLNSLETTIYFNNFNLPTYTDLFLVVILAILYIKIRWKFLSIRVETVYEKLAESGNKTKKFFLHYFYGSRVFLTLAIRKLFLGRWCIGVPLYVLYRLWSVKRLLGKEEEEEEEEGQGPAHPFISPGFRCSYFPSCNVFESHKSCAYTYSNVTHNTIKQNRANMC